MGTCVTALRCGVCRLPSVPQRVEVDARIGASDVVVTLRQGPVDEEQINVVQPAAAQGFVQAGDGAVLSLEGAIQCL